MKKSVLYSLSILSAVLFLFSFLVLTGCKKEAEKVSVEGIVVFAVGSVEILRGGGSEPAEIGSRITEGDTLVSGAGSNAAIQIGDVGVVRIVENTTVIFNELFSGERGEIEISGGMVLSKVSRLKRGDSFDVKTPTSVAGVRGTEFSVAYSSETQKSSYAVRKGSVSVSTPRKSPDAEKVEYVERATLEAGSAAEVSVPDVDPAKKAEVEPVVETRAITPSEALVIEKVAIVPVIENIDRKTREEIAETSMIYSAETRKIEEEVIKLEKEEAEKKEAENEEAQVKVKQEKIERLVKQESATIQEIKETFNRVDEITLYSGRVIRGAIISRGDVLKVFTEDGTVNIKDIEIQNINVIR